MWVTQWPCTYQTPSPVPSVLLLPKELVADQTVFLTSSILGEIPNPGNGSGGGFPFGLRLGWGGLGGWGVGGRGV